MTLFLSSLFVLALGGYLYGKLEHGDGVRAVHLNWVGWLVALGAFAVLVLSLATARAADPTDCHGLGKQVGDVVLAATDDIDLAQAVEASAEAHCIVLDEPPVVIKVEPQKAALAPPAPAQSAKDKWCRQHFGSYRQADGSVLPLKGRKRKPCPFPG